MNKLEDKILTQDQANIDLPMLNVNLQPTNITKDEEIPVVTNEKMIVLTNEILDYCREDRKDANDAFKTMFDMVVNEGDATAASKEALVQLLKLRSDVTDKMGKVMDLLMRYILKDRDTFPKYLNAQQENNFVFKGKSQVRKVLEKLKEDKVHEK